MEIPRGRGVLKVKILEAKCEAKLKFPGGGGGGMGGAKQKTFCGRSMDIFWNSTLLFECELAVDFIFKLTLFVVDAGKDWSQF